MATLISVDGKTQFVEPKNKGVFDLEELQAFVGGRIEFVTLDETRSLCVNEEGKLLDLPLNQLATAFASPYLRNDYIAGPALVLDRKEAGYEDPFEDD